MNVNSERGQEGAEVTDLFGPGACAIDDYNNEDLASLVSSHHQGGLTTTYSS